MTAEVGVVMRRLVRCGDGWIGRWMQRALVVEERAIDGGQLDGAIRDGRARLTCIQRIDSGHCARRAIHRGLLLVLLPRGICRHHCCPRRTTTCERREGERDGGGPTFLCKRVPGGRAWMELCQKECSRSRGTRNCA